MSTTRRRVAFRSKPLVRNGTLTKQSQATQWQPSGPFHFLDLPAELRAEILKLAILDARKNSSVVELMLVSQQLHDEVASTARKTTVLDMTRAHENVTYLVNAFSSAGSTANVSLWRHVRYLVFRFHLLEHISIFGSPLAALLQFMTQHHKLSSLRLEIVSKFPSDDFWGSVTTDIENGDAAHVSEPTFTHDPWQLCYMTTGSTRRAKGGTDADIFAPSLVSSTSFQNFLKFLFQSTVSQISLLVDAKDHQRFWCAFHQKRGAVLDFSTMACVGIPVSARQVEIDHKELIRTFAGARLS